MACNCQPLVASHVGKYGNKRKWDALEQPEVQEHLEFELSRIGDTLLQEVISFAGPGMIGDEDATRRPIGGKGGRPISNSNIVKHHSSPLSFAPMDRKKAIQNTCNGSCLN